MAHPVSAQWQMMMMTFTDATMAPFFYPDIFCQLILS